MRPGAIMCNQGECMWLHLDLIGEVLKHCTQVFPSVDYAFTTIPTYPSGQIGFLVCSTSPGHVLRSPVRAPEPSVASALKYYSPAVHASSFVLPVFAGFPLCPLLPRTSVELHTVFGKALHLPRIDEPSREDVDAWHAKYVAALKELYEEHKAQFGYGDRELQIE